MLLCLREKHLLLCYYVLEKTSVIMLLCLRKKHLLLCYYVLEKTSVIMLLCLKESICYYVTMS